MKDDDLEELEEEKENGNSFKEFYEANKKIILILGGLFLILLLLLLFNGCSNNSTNNGSKLIPQINILSNENMLSVGNSIQLSIETENISDNLIVWSSSDDTVVVVDQQGNVSALKLGKVTITALYKHTDGKDYKDTCEIIVAEGNTSITITDVTFPEGELLITKGDEYQLLKIVTPTDGCVNNISYTSSDSSVLKVDENGIIKALKEGTAVVKMVVNDGKFYDEMIINVVMDNVEPQLITNPTQIKFIDQKTSLVIGETKELQYNYLPNNAYIKGIEWTSSDPLVAVISKDGKVTALKEGMTIITLKTRNNLFATTTVFVEKKVVNVTSITLASLQNLTMNIGDLSQIIPNVLPVDATDKSVTYSSSNPRVLTVDSNGVMNAIAAGDATVTVRTNDQGKTAHVYVVVRGNNAGSNDDSNDDGNQDNNTDYCTTNSLITISSNSKEYTDNGDGAIVTNSNGGTAIITKGSEILVSTGNISDASNCGGIKSLKYCSGDYKGYDCTSFKSFTRGDDLPIKIPTGNGIVQFIIKLELKTGETRIKKYYMKYNRELPVVNKACYTHNTLGAYYWGNYANNSNYTYYGSSERYCTMKNITVNLTFDSSDTKTFANVTFVKMKVKPTNKISVIKNIYYCVSPNTDILLYSDVNKVTAKNTLSSGGNKFEIQPGNTCGGGGATYYEAYVEKGKMICATVTLYNGNTRYSCIKAG